MRFTSSVLALLMTALTCVPAQSGPVTDEAIKAEAAVTAGDFDAWYAANEALLDAAWAAGGFHFGTVIATTADAAAYGNFEPRDNAIYAPGEPIHFYIEPRGYGYGDLGDGMLEMAFDVDLKILDPEGNLLLEQSDFASIAVKSRTHARELMVNLTANLEGAPSGVYNLDFTFRDRHSDQSANVTMEITIQ